jgi:tRNA threonylcarbamoyladenosine biosynthesis protein TsaB
MLLLGIDTCGPSGSAALGRRVGDAVEILGLKELEGRTYSATLVSAVEGLVKTSVVGLRDVGCIVVVHGPGSFTGVRVGLSVAKGLAEGAGISLIAVSRLRVLAGKAGGEAGALDAHRHELFLRIGEPEPRELLAGADELVRLAPPGEIAVCDDPADALLGQVWPSVRRVRVTPPTAADALVIAMPAIVNGRFAEAALLDGHYLRRSDAEIFGNTVSKP